MSSTSPSRAPGPSQERRNIAGERDDPPSERVSWRQATKIAQAMLVVVLGLVAVYTVPELQFARPWNPGQPVPFWNVVGRPFEGEEVQQAQERAAEVDAVAQEVLAAEEPMPPPVKAEPEVVEPEPQQKLPAFEPREGDDKDVVQSLELPNGNELDRFFESLARSEASLAGSTTRVAHWGDSAIGVDGIPSAIRRRMHNRFGDAGHGFHLMAPPNTSYRHSEVDFSHNERWRRCFIIHKCRPDGHYGLGGTTFRSTGGAKSTFAPHPERSSGRVSKMEVWYAAQPTGGRLRLRIDDGEEVVVETQAEVLEDRFHTFELPDGMHELQVEAAGGGEVRVYGVTLERDSPGVVWDGLALVGAFTNRMLEFDDEHLRAQLEQREPNLAVFMFGGNDMVRRISMKKYAQEYRQVVRKLRSARPDMDCLIMAPLDHGERRGVQIVSRPVVARMVKAQRQVAESEGCAFFDTYAAMGGEGSAGRWFKRRPRLMSGDLGHATRRGHQVIGELFYRALLEAYVAYRQKMDAQGGIMVEPQGSTSLEER